MPPVSSQSSQLGLASIFENLELHSTADLFTYLMGWIIVEKVERLSKLLENRECRTAEHGLIQLLDISQDLQASYYTMYLKPLQSLLLSGSKYARRSVSTRNSCSPRGSLEVELVGLVVLIHCAKPSAKFPPLDCRVCEFATSRMGLVLKIAAPAAQPTALSDSTRPFAKSVQPTNTRASPQLTCLRCIRSWQHTIKHESLPWSVPDVGRSRPIIRSNLGLIQPHLQCDPLMNTLMVYSFDLC